MPGPQSRRKKSPKTRRFGKILKGKRKSPDLDQIQEEIRLEQTGKSKTLHIDADLPGLGQFYCSACARYFTSDRVLNEHCRTKVHKRQVKRTLEKPYSHEEAEAGAGMSAAMK